MNNDWPNIRDIKRTTISPWIEVIARDVQLSPDAATETYYAIGQPTYLAAIAVAPDGRILLVHQYRPAIDGFSLELPAGLLETDEDPQKAMIRELLEETGHSTQSIELIGKGATCSSRISNAMLSFFIRTGKRIPDFVEEPGICVRSVTPTELRGLILSGEFREQTHLGVLSLAACRGLIQI